MLTMSFSSHYRLIIKEESVVTTNVEISRYYKDPETPQDATKLYWAFKRASQRSKNNEH